jgi:Phytanoyl-CoA dioxygenase (PhyH)
MGSGLKSFTSSSDQSIEHFRVHGWLRVPKAFDCDAAATMREVVWDGLADVGVSRDAPTTWTIERPGKLQKLKDHPAFTAVGSARLLTAIDAILESRAYEKPKRWGAIFLAFPTKDEWGVPASGWHVDAKYTSQLWPPNGVQTHALFGDIAPRSGATQILSGSHRLIHQWFKDHPPPAGAHSADMRKSLQTHPYVRDLHTEGDREARIERFMNRVEDVDGIPLQVVENIGAAGDVILLHPLTLHVAAPNNGGAPRFLLSGAVTTDMHGWAGAL